MTRRDQYGAGPATLGFDGNPFGVEHIIDCATGRPLYKHPPCAICGVSSWWSTPEPQDCKACARGAVARNENEIGVVDEVRLL